jgi:general stress protein YciG
MIYEFFFYFFLLKTNGKIHCKERHQRERAEAGGRQTQVNQSPKVYQEILSLKGGS